MLKKVRAAGLIAAAAGAMMMAGGPLAYAGSHPDEVNIWSNEEDNDWNGAINLLNSNNIQVPIGVCGNDINAVLGINLPIASPDIVGNCSSASVVVDD